MTTSDFESVLDACLTDVASGSRTVEECLADWPQWRDRLEAPLRSAALVQNLRLPATPPDPTRRAELMSAIASTPQQRPRRRFPTIPSFRGAFRPLALAVPAAALAAVALLLVLARPGGDSTADAATLTTFGTVERAEDGGWHPLADNDEVTAGDQLRTTAEASAILTFSDGTTVTLNPATEVVIEQSRGGDDRRIELRQLAGRVWSNVATGQPTGSFVVHTVDATVTAHGTVFETSIVEGETAISAAEGTVEVRSGEDRVTLSAGETLRARLGARLARPALQPADSVRITADGPFVASLISPRGLATGARPDGFVYQQIPRTLTTNPADGPQQISMLLPVEGVYTLVVRRVEDGSGNIEVTTGGATQQIPIRDAVAALSVKLRVAITAGQASVAVESMTPVDPRRIDQAERLIITDRIRARAADRLREFQERRRSQQGQTPTPAPTRPVR